MNLLRLALFCLLSAAAAARADFPVTTLERAAFVVAPVTARHAVPPPDSADWQPQALPDAWRDSHPELHGSGWYRFRFMVTPGDDPLQAVFLPKLGLNAAVWLNGVFIGDGGRFDDPVSRNWNRPLLFLVPPGTLKPGANVLHIHLRGHAYTQASLHPPKIGPDRVLRPMYERDHFLRITLNQTASLLIASVGVLMLALWLQRRQDTAYAWFAASALVWAAQSVNLYVRDVPFTTAQWEVLINASFQVFSALLMVSLLRFAEAGGRPLIPALMLSALLGPLTMWLAPDVQAIRVSAFWHLYTLAGAAATLAFLLRAAIRWHNRDARLLVGALGVVVMLAAHDWLMHSRHLLPGGRHLLLDDVYLLHYGAPLLFLAVGLIMTSRFVRVLNEFERLNEELEARVRLKHAQLEQTFARVREMEMEQAVTDERERIYRDLHDDVGAKLLSLVYRAGSPSAADLARSALQDLRDVVSRSGSDRFRMDEVAADWRAECEKRLAEAAIPLAWSQYGALGEVILSQPQVLNVGRVLREAVTNVIRHAQAGGVWIELGSDGHRLALRVCDDGVGLKGGEPAAATPGSGPGGRGLRNMDARAARLGGVLLRRQAPQGGLEVLLELPLAASPAAA